MQWKVLASLMLASALAAGQAQTASSTAKPASTRTTARSKKKVTKEVKPSVESQIQALRQEMQSQIQGLKQELSDRDSQLQAAKAQAAAAQQAAQEAQSALQSQQAAVAQTTQTVNTLSSSVDDLKTNTASIVTTVQDEQTKTRAAIESPDAIHFKGATISFTGSFIAAETTWRGGATGGDVNTPFTGIPLEHSEAFQLSEFQGTGRQSRLAIKGTGKLANMTLTGYYEADWLSAGITSNNNQSNSYTMRQRQLWAEAKTASGWTFNGGQGWSLATETTQGMTRGTEILPATIDAQYEPGFVWARQYSFRVIKDFGKTFFLGASVEGAQTLNPAGQNLPTNILIGSGGTGGGLYNSTANYAFNYTPDFVVKMALEPGWGHWELFGIERNFRDRIYPTSGTPYNDTQTGAGIGGGFRGPLLKKKVTIGLKGLWGQGVGRYGSSTIADVTIRPNGQLSPLHGFSGLSTIELNPTPRLNIYFNYGGDYIGRDYVISGANQVGYGTRAANMSGCRIEPASTASFPSADPITPGTTANPCSGNNKDVQEFTIGWWYNIYSGPKGRLRQGLQYSNIRRDLWSGNGGTLNPGNGANGNDNMVFTSFRYYLP